jgi:hypothetical protein
MTPADFVETVRIGAARQMLEAGERPKQAAAACGFTDIDTFRRAFQRQVGVTPAEYRRRYEVAEAARFCRFCCDDFAAFAAKAGDHCGIKIVLGAKRGTYWYAVSHAG